MPRQRPQAARDQRIVELHNTTQMSLAEIGAEFGISHQRVHKILQREGVVPSTRRAQPASDLAVALAAEGRRVSEMMRELGVSRSTVYRILQMQKVEIQHARELPEEKAAQLSHLYSLVPKYNRGRTVCTSEEGEAFVDYVAQLQQEGYSGRLIGRALQLTPSRIYQWLRYYGYFGRRSQQP